MSKPKPIHETIRINSQKQCRVKGCSKHRHRISRYCAAHSRMSNFHGHPEAVALRASEFALEKAQVSYIIDINKEKHKGIQYALNYLSNLLSPPMNDYSKIKFPQIWCNLHCHGVTAEEVLKTAAAVYLLQENSSRLVKDDRHFQFTLGHAVIKLCKIHGFNIQGAMRRDIGERLQRKLGVLCMNIAKTTRATAQKQNEVLIIQSSPLEVNPPDGYQEQPDRQLVTQTEEQQVEG